MGGSQGRLDLPPWDAPDCGSKAVWMLEVDMKERVQTAGLAFFVPPRLSVAHKASGMSAEVQPLTSQVTLGSSVNQSSLLCSQGLQWDLCS